MSKTVPLSIILLFLVSILFPICSAQDQSGQPQTLLGLDPQIVSPYDRIDFQNMSQYRAALHTHTTESDGFKTVSASVSAHEAAGYDILAITDHWIHTVNNDPTGMLMIDGSEPSHDVHHTISLFTDFAAIGTMHHDLEQTMREVASRGGIQFFAHPYGYINSANGHDYGPSWYRDLFDAYPHLLGMEVSAFSGYEPTVAQLWDVLLVHYGQSRPVYAFGASDYHGFLINTASTIILSESLDSDTVKQAMMDGRMFYTSKGHGSVPSIFDINVEGPTITVSTDGPDLRWINNGKALGNGSSYTFNGSELSNYIRLEVWNGSSMIGTQAFFLTGADMVRDTEPPSASANDDHALRAGDILTFDGRASTDNVGIMNFTWTFHDAMDVMLHGPMPTYQFKNPGLYEVTLVVTDVANNTHSTIIQVLVDGPDDLPAWVWITILALASTSLIIISRAFL